GDDEEDLSGGLPEERRLVVDPHRHADVDEEEDRVADDADGPGPDAAEHPPDRTGETEADPDDLHERASVAGEFGAGRAAPFDDVHAWSGPRVPLSSGLSPSAPGS